MSDVAPRIIALSGGVGGAKLVCGLADALPPEALLVVANTADDFEHLGLTICPDLDSVMYALAGINDTERGWGLADESWQALEALDRLGGESWFRLGDRDLATHLRRSSALAGGCSLTDITGQMTGALGIEHRVVPMTDDPVRTLVNTDEGELPFQHYFVRRQCEPVYRGVRFEGIEQAAVQPLLLQALAQRPAAVVICPSNPFVSVDPILSLPGLRNALADSGVPVIAVSPIVAGQALKGPAAKMLRESGMPASAAAVMQYYGDLLDAFVVQTGDKVPAVDGIDIIETQTIMKTQKDRRQLAATILDWVAGNRP